MENGPCCGVLTVFELQEGPVRKSPQIMFALTFSLVVCFSVASSRVYKPKNQPPVVPSIVNLGKMDWNIYINGKSPASPKSENEMFHPSKPLMTRSDPDGCPCQQDALLKNKLPNIPDMFSQILLNNDPFKDPIISSHCCTSFEETKEFFIDFDPKKTEPHAIMQSLPGMSHFSPMTNAMSSFQSMPMDKLFPKPMQFLPFILDTLNKEKGPLNSKTKTIEIFLLPTKKPIVVRPVSKKTTVTETTTTKVTSPEIKLVGDKESTMLYDVMSNNASVKKDLTQDLETGAKEIEIELITPSAAPFNNNNTL